MKKYAKAVWQRVWTDLKEYGMAFVLLAGYTVFMNLVFHAFCPLVIFSGFPCPGCGVTRAMACFVTGRWEQAWLFNPVVFPVAATAVYFVFRRYMAGKRVRGILGLAAVYVVLLVLVYVVRMYLYFPDRIPYIYHEDNVLARFLPFYQQMLHGIGIL